ncbi:YdcF family protein [Kitasatospora sp. NBC_01287]|uniref:YdcF family protein n=1 Tax=Kitasatospora sp. NBC_01287 TaxID=2903573 RepID=UPI00224F4DB6|nr:YdcF family protein [Kitasatospora sp. NBC_01287]MCX4749184.1 YdcF family protein [Kitasatospora sp. NBC_01287]
MTGTNQRGITDRQWADTALLWDYQQMGHDLRPCDVAIGLGSHDLGVAAEAAGLYLRGLVSRIVFTGGPNPSRPDHFPRGEAVHFAEHALSLGVPQSAVLTEPNARNTGQNIAFSRDVLAGAAVAVSSVLLVSMPYMERRAYATCRKVWPEVEAVCASTPMDLHDYVKTIGDDTLVIDSLVGDLQRVIEYPKLGFAVAQDVPERVHDAYQRLITDGFDSRLLT